MGGVLAGSSQLAARRGPRAAGCGLLGRPRAAGGLLGRRRAGQFAKVGIAKFCEGALAGKNRRYEACALGSQKLECKVLRRPRPQKLACKVLRRGPGRQEPQVNGLRARFAKVRMQSFAEVGSGGAPQKLAYKLLRRLGEARLSKLGGWTARKSADQGPEARRTTRRGSFGR